MAMETLAPLALAKGRKAKTKGPGSDVGAGSLPCPPIGPHWDNIGFQGLDPRTDVNRSMKMLALLQVTTMVQYKHSHTHSSCESPSMYL